MAPLRSAITQRAIARALKEAKKQGCELMEIKPTGEVLLYLKPNIPIPNSAAHADSFESLLRKEYDFKIKF